MELRQLEYFVTVAEELHFGRAARRLHIAEQPLSYQIKRLEEDLGFKLFDRTTRSVSITPAGTALLADARDILSRAGRAADTARRVAAGEAGVVRLGYESATVPSILPDFVKLFRAEHPRIGLTLVEHSKAGLSAIAEGKEDACIVTRYERLPSWVDFVPILGDRAVVALPADHALARKDAIRAAELSRIPFLGYEGASSGPVNQFLARLAVQSDVDLGVSQEAESYMALLGLVAAGLGCTVVTASMSDLFSDRIAYRPLVDPSVNVDYGLALRRGDEAPVLSTLRSTAEHLGKAI